MLCSGVPALPVAVAVAAESGRLPSLVLNGRHGGRLNLLTAGEVISFAAYIVIDERSRVAVQPQERSVVRCQGELVGAGDRGIEETAVAPRKGRCGGRGCARSRLGMVVDRCLHAGMPEQTVRIMTQLVSSCSL